VCGCAEALAKRPELEVRVEKGKVHKKQDIAGAGDPYVVLRLNGAEKKTTTQKDTLQPVWDEGCVWLCVM
jgi:Ca2+-dependent lipid-binding protein